MLLTRAYYFLKPLLPWRLRMGLRRIRARRLRKTCADRWPILDSAGTRPDWFTGWPDGKKFAFVLTHDVEGQRGVERCQQLAELEMQHGFRSSFNFIPEGDYETPAALREWLVANGFEVGVHDLQHDGKLYRSHKAFVYHAKKINEYLREWQAVGFRSGFMFHNLDWLHALDVLYDASTFDTDPFEPQPDSVGTIFPFWVSRDYHSGYVELPYTLPQDSTLFLVLRERTTHIWKEKLEWVADRGGMALMTVHPDYTSLQGNGRPSEFSVRLYEEFLQWVAEHYKNQYWLALPREVAEYVKACRDNGLVIPQVSKKPFHQE